MNTLYDNRPHTNGTIIHVYRIYSGCQKYESSPIFVTKLEVRLYPEFLNTQTCTFGPQICTLSTLTCTFCSTIASDFFTTFIDNIN